MGDSLASRVHEKFAQLKCHINRNEWTVLAGIAIKRRPSYSEYEVVSIGTGLKCLPLEAYSNRPAYESLVHDFHGEIVARRGFLLYILDQIANADELGEKCTLESTDRGWCFKEGITVHMFVSHAPCGDASMRELVNSSKNDLDEDSDHTEAKRRKYAEDQDLRRGREDFSAPLGSLRTKPGRADAPYAACMSCSDKIASWTALGIQGGLLMDILCEPIYLASITVGDMFDAESLYRALNSRIPYDLFKFDLYGFKVTPLQIFSTDEKFAYRKEEGRTSTWEAISWYKGCPKPEYIVKGRRKGVKLPKSENDPTYLNASITASPRISKFRIFEYFCAIWQNCSCDLSNARRKNQPYQEAKARLMTLPNYKCWIRGPSGD